jgi:tetratricopeptide (TPR) repeat protein
MFYLDQDRPQEALTWLEKAASAAPKPPTSLGYSWLPGVREEYLGQAQLLLANPAQAAIAYQTMLATRPSQPPTITPSLRRRARTLLVERRYRALVELLQPVAVGDVEALRWLAKAEWQLREWDRAFGYLAQGQFALSQSPHDPNIGLLLDLLEQSPQGLWSTLTHLIDRSLANTGRSALASLQHIADLFSLPVSELIRQHGRRLISQKDYPCAAEAFALLVHLAPTDADAYKAFGVALSGLGHKAEALAAWQVAESLTVESIHEP